MLLPFLLQPVCCDTLSTGKGFTADLSAQYFTKGFSPRRSVEEKTMFLAGNQQVSQFISHL